ncbi:MAG: hypothetical protein WCI74_17560, partial [Actinomycetes bacterium]
MSARRPAPNIIGFCAALLDTDNTGADPVETARQVEWLLARFSPAPRAGIRAGFATIDATAVAMTGKRMSALDQQGRSRVLDRIVATPTTATLVDLLKVPVLLAAGANASS